MRSVGSGVIETGAFITVDHTTARCLLNVVDICMAENAIPVNEKENQSIHLLGSLKVSVKKLMQAMRSRGKKNNPAKSLSLPVSIEG